MGGSKFAQFIAVEGALLTPPQPHPSQIVLHEYLEWEIQSVICILPRKNVKAHKHLRFNESFRGNI